MTDKKKDEEKKDPENKDEQGDSKAPELPGTPKAPEKAKDSKKEKKAEKEPEESCLEIPNNRILCSVEGTITGIAMKKGDGASFKEVKFLTGSLKELQELEPYFGRGVRVVFMMSDDLFSNFSDIEKKKDEKEKKKKEPAKKPEPGKDKEPEKTPEKAKPGDGKPGDGAKGPDDEGTAGKDSGSDTVPAGKPEPGKDRKPAPVEPPTCPKCGNPMMVNPADEAQLICQVGSCPGEAKNPDFNEPEFE